MNERKAPQLDSGIKVHKDGGMTLTGDGVTTYRNLTLYSGLCLECLTGLKMSRVITAQAAAKRDFGFKGSKITVFQLLGLKFIEMGYITKEEHVKNLIKLQEKNKITTDKYAEFVKALEVNK